MEWLLELLISKLETDELRLIDVNFKRKFVIISHIKSYSNFNLNKSKCTIEPYLASEEVFKPLEESGYVIKFVGCYGNGMEEEIIFNTWLNNTHTGYGNTIVARGWNGTPFLNFYNNGTQIFFPKNKELISEFISPNKVKF